MTAANAAPIRVDIWSDIACPWCAIGAARLDSAMKSIAERDDAPEFEVRYHAYQLDPDAEHTHLTHAEDLARRKGLAVEQVNEMFARVAEAGAPDGLRFDFDRVKSANTRKGHELIAYAADRGKQREAVDALHKAYFTQGVDVEDLDALVAIGEQLGFDGAQVRAALESGELETRVDIDIDEAKRLGVSGVPFFVFDAKYAFAGAQPADTIVKVVDHVLGERAGATASA